MTEPSFRPAEERDLPGILEIYNGYILNTTATFHIRPVALETMREIIRPGHPLYRSFVVEEGGVLRGYVLLMRYHEREAYDRTAEVTIYLAPDAVSRGIGGRALCFIEGVAAQ
ncbi:MAG: GNAT family N-acetyltransferase, partial [Clostridia bacterium]|nr:GNAT family N-acetyltransferase [Clostridia bacterium]